MYKWQLKKDPVIKHLIKFAHLHFSLCPKIIKTYPDVKQSFKTSS